MCTGNSHKKGSRSRRNSVSRWRGYIAIVLIVILYLSVWFGMAYALNTDRPITVVEGRSMLDKLKNGDLVVLKGVPAEELSPGDIVVYRAPQQKPIIHRIYLVVYDAEGNIEGFRTKGDNNPVPDPYIVKKEWVTGKVIWGPIPYLGLPILFFQSPLGLSIILLIIIILVMLSVYSELKGKPTENLKKSTSTASL